MWYFILFSVFFVSIKGEDPAQEVVHHSILPSGRCIPTAVEVGPCHTCVCDYSGFFNCRYNYCDNDKLNEITQQGKVPLNVDQAECTPNVLYKDGILWCTCSDKKRWKSESCRHNFYHTRTKIPSKQQPVSFETISCDPNSYYAVDCNICLCTTGTLDQSSCTNRTCFEGNKIDDCKYGQVLRLDEELCTCSELGYYVDKLCIKVKGLNAKLEQTDLAILTHADKGLKKDARTLNFNNDQKCEPNSVFHVDCNRCWCSSDGKDMQCTVKLCASDILKESMFQGKSEVRSSLPKIDSLTSPCTPGQYYRYQCKTCYCNKDGTLSCTSMICLDTGNDHKADLLQGSNSPNEIREGETCIKGQMYKIDCNTCSCNDNNRMMCTKTVCLPAEERHKLSKLEKKHHMRAQFLHDKESTNNGEIKKTIHLNKNVKDSNIQSTREGTRELLADTDQLAIVGDEDEEILNEDIDDNDKDIDDNDKDIDDKFVPIKLTNDKGQFPALNPRAKCTPGHIYSKGCQRCFCSDKKIAKCTNKPCKQLSETVMVPTDISPAISAAEFARLEKLSNEAAKCNPGKSYKVKCNMCLCLANGNLLCGNRLCPSIADINLNTAWKFTGKHCKPADPQPSECITCTCEKNNFKCTPKPKCVPRAFNDAYQLNAVKDLDLSTSQKCVPDMLYRQACNECYCQADHTLRCTRKGCLTYTQVKKLNQLRQRLLHEGL